MSEKKLFSIKNIILTSVVCLLPIVLGFALWDKLPEEIPQQYGWYDQVNWSLPKFWGIITMPLFMAVINVIYLLAFRFSKQKFSPRVEGIMSWMIPALSVVLGSFMLLKPIGFDIDVFCIVGFVLSILFIIIGNYLPKTEPNPVAGTRAPWINKNPEVWSKTQRVSGILLVIIGIINLVTCFLPFGKYVFVATVFPGIIFVLIYSLVISKKINKATEEK
jgi:uncharacterized membrane protein